jgi:hypothetical protein
MERFEAKIEETDRGGAFVAVPADVVDALGGKGRIPVRATFDGVAYEGSVVFLPSPRSSGVGHRSQETRNASAPDHPDNRALR